MNLVHFLKEVDGNTKTMSDSELSAFVHEVARVLPKEKRMDFLRKLQESSGQKDLKKQMERHESGMAEKYKVLKAKLECIKEGIMRLSGSLNEEYDNWYSSDSEKFIYEDPQKVLDILKEASDFLRQCVDSAVYKQGYGIAELLVELEIQIDGDYLEYTDEPINIKDLAYYKLGNLDYDRLLMDAMYVTYQYKPLKERAKALYELIEISQTSNITLESMMQIGEALPDLEEFLPLWIAYLGKKSSKYSEKLLNEALELSDDEGKVLENARKYRDLHPALYEQYLLNCLGKVEDKKWLEIGNEALDMINCKYVVRSRIALLMSKQLLCLGMQEQAEKCWIEAFYSDTRVVNFLRIFMECNDFSDIQDQVKEIYHKIYGNRRTSRTLTHREGELKENEVSDTMLYMLYFFGGEFDFVLNHAMRCKDALGWSSTFMKCGLSVFLLLLLESEKLDVGCNALLKKVEYEVEFKIKDYQNGLVDIHTEEDNEWFWKCFYHWKNTVAIKEEEKEKYLHRMEKLIERRVKAIVEGNHNTYYAECAIYIAALGEVKESRGDKEGKQKVLRKYKSAYPRRRGLHRELRAYGMVDKK